VSGDGAADELVEVVDVDGNVEAVVRRAEMRSGRLRHRTVFIAVVDGSGRVLVHRRADDKDVWPSRWDLAAGGVVGVDEPWTDAAERELAEELGVVGCPLEPLGAGTYEDDDVAIVGHVYLARTGGPFRFADGEVVEARFVTAPELDDLRAVEPFCPDSVALVLPRIVGLMGPPA
jgi:8-oxo-dGTP pyrophosphatase MutT (NUDIX family)